MEPIRKLLGVTRGLTAVIGSGGKTSLLYELAEELRKDEGPKLALGDGGRLCRRPVRCCFKSSIL